MDYVYQHCQAAIDLLKTARGQVEATLRMVESGRNCIDVSRQVHASVALMKKANLVLLKERLDTCVKEATKGRDTSEKVHEITLILDEYLETGGGTK